MVLFFFMIHRRPISALFPYTTLFRSCCSSWSKRMRTGSAISTGTGQMRSEEHTSELQSRGHLVCRPLLEKKDILLPPVIHPAPGNNRLHGLDGYAAESAPPSRRCPTW